MSLLAIQAALEKHLLTLAPAIATAVENKTFTPVTGQPYQRLNHLLNTPRDITIERGLVQELGVFQVSLCYPLDAGRVPAMQRAEAIKALFAAGLSLYEGAVRVDIERTPSIAGGMVDEDRWMLPVSVYWQAFISN